MSIARKPNAVPGAAAEQAVDAVISRGLRPAEDREATPDGKTIETTIRFRPPARFLYESMLKAVERRQKSAFTRFSQHDWLLEAIAEKLKRDGFLEGEWSCPRQRGSNRVRRRHGEAGEEQEDHDT